MQTGYFWPVYGEENEVCFPFHPSRSADFVASALGLKAAVGSVLLTDGYAAYRRYAEKIGITHANAGHTRAVASSRRSMPSLTARPARSSRSRRCTPSRRKFAIKNSPAKPSKFIA
jgi:hypothetical protein